jgi:hypothetical protein
MAGLLQVPPKSSFEKLLLGTGLWQHAKMSTCLKSPDGLKDAECKIGQLSHQPPIPYVPVVDVVTPKEEPQIFKIKLPDASHLSMPIYSRGNNEEYLAHVVAVLHMSSNRRGCPRSAECSPRLLQDGPRHIRISKKPQNLETPSQQL